MRFASTHCDVSMNTAARKVHATRFSIEKTWYGRPCAGRSANLPKMIVKTIIVRSGCSTAQAIPISDCL